MLFAMGLDKCREQPILFNHCFAALKENSDKHLLRFQRHRSSSWSDHNVRDVKFHQLYLAETIWS
ncbi:hypothetical protein PILCRDRAFT_725320 [Piloderma croceum F 1598]|uniref:Uncharacterized protein n=1 Tax=Piloderma croceum (strain F 1598) TaxID=765440 RepID=A0A0C3F0S3_PILCF|nr:hypothetical protein PILCRDRAFT_725320 [Piloderma croceum F 1598]